MKYVNNVLNNLAAYSEIRAEIIWIFGGVDPVFMSWEKYNDHKARICIATSLHTVRYTIVS